MPHILRCIFNFIFLCFFKKLVKKVEETVVGVVKVVTVVVVGGAAGVVIAIENKNAPLDLAPNLNQKNPNVTTAPSQEIAQGNEPLSAPPHANAALTAIDPAPSRGVIALDHVKTVAAVDITRVVVQGHRIIDVYDLLS